MSQNRTRTDAREVAASGWIVTDIDTCEDITAVDPKRRLPMLQSKDEGDSPPRPRWEWIGFVEDFFAVAVLLALIVFSIIRLKNAPEKLERKSRFYGSHTGAAWLTRTPRGVHWTPRT